MAERRYNDKEIAAIFRAAAEEGPQSPQREVARDEGLTLAELQAIGSEVGIPSDAVAQAAEPSMCVSALRRGRSWDCPSAWPGPSISTGRSPMRSGSVSSCNCVKFS